MADRRTWRKFEGRFLHIDAGQFQADLFYSLVPCHRDPQWIVPCTKSPPLPHQLHGFAAARVSAAHLFGLYLPLPSMDSTTSLTIDCDLAPATEDIATVRAGLMAFNDSKAGPVDLQRVGIYLRDAQNVICGGLVGFLAWQWLSVDLLWVEESLRGRGYGSEILDRAERVAREAGCVAVKLDTYEFQARPFYERRGYVVFGVLEGYPANTRTYYLQKAL